MEQKKIYLAPESVFSPEHTFSCGQCFRWDRQPDGAYTGVALGEAARLFAENSGVYLESSGGAEAGWRRYFDLDRDYAAIVRGFCADGFTAKAVAFGQGLRLLRQEPWETLCTFIVSQCNHMPRIRQIVSDLCRLFGERFSWRGASFVRFPSFERVASLSPGDLAPVRAGYRAPYILETARMLASGELLLHELAALPTEEARQKVMALPGVGVKVADCFLLFGLGRFDAFPVDTWIKKAARFYENGLCAAQFGEYAGIAQQYIFHYVRNAGIEK